MDHLQLLDTPRRQSITAQSTNLRTALKEWEKSFASSHSGRKPGKDDIKADLVIAKKYKEYNRLRDVLAGKLGVEVLNEVKSPRQEKGRPRLEAGIASTPRRQRRDSKTTPHAYRLQTTSIHPSQLDPYDPPVSASPRPFLLSAIGPTPQRDGKVLGLFDLLSNSGRSSQATPSSKKRKIDSLLGEDTIADKKRCIQTPCRRKQGPGDLLEHLTGDLLEVTPGRKHSKSPTSEGKKFMLSHFFATPNTLRYSSFVEDRKSSIANDIAMTPVKEKELDTIPPEHAVEEKPAHDATPAYLKRSFSFKDRLLSSSGSTTSSIFHNKISQLSSPPLIRKGGRVLQRTRSLPKPLSQIVRDLRQMEEVQHDDDLDALREIEGGNVNPQTSEIQEQIVTSDLDNENSINLGTEEIPARVWKKKGQKRSTRRSVMRPTKVKLNEESNFVAVEEDDVDPIEADTSRIEETRLAHAGENSFEFDDIADEDLQDFADEIDKKKGRSWKDPDHESTNELEEDFNDNFEDDVFHDEGFDPKQTTKRPTKHGQKTKKGEKRVEKKDKTSISTTGKINPNALSHMNFRTLKIRNKNSKGKGGGRFGGRFGGKGRR